MKKFIPLIICLYGLSTIEAQAADDWCWEKIDYPPSMFGKWSSRLRNSSSFVEKTFKRNADTLPQRPAEMMEGLAYLEVLLNEVCWDRHGNRQAQKKLGKVVLDIRTSLGLPSDMPRTKIINIYWSTAKLLSLATVEKLEVDEARQEGIKKLKQLKATLKAELKEYQDDL